MSETGDKNLMQNQAGGIFGASSGQMGKRIHAFDWAANTLGQSKYWPQSLQSALSICLNSNFPIAIYWGPDLVLLYNDAWSPIPGNKHPWALGKPAREVWPEIWDEIAPQFEKAFNGIPGGSNDALLPMQRHGYTEECYFDFTFTPIYGESGKVEGIFNAVIETTYRVIAERRASILQKLSDTLNGNLSSKEVYNNSKSILESAKQDVPFFCIFELADDGTHDIKASSNGLVISNAPGIAELLRSGITTKITSLENYFESFPDGYWPERSHEALVIPLKSNDNKVTGGLIGGISSRRGFDKDYQGFYESIGIVVCGEVNTIKSLEDERKRAELLQALDKAKTTFFSNISHEFRTPLTLMLGPLEELLQNPTRPPKEQRQLEATHRNAMRLLRLVNTLLDFSRLESGRVKAMYAPVRLATLTRDLASSFRSAIEQAGLQYEIAVDEIHESIYIDREMWEKIVLNLISNAFKYTLQGHVIVSLKNGDQKAIFSVTDTGIGIPRSELPKMFERFHRIENAKGRTHEGSGIGLSLVNELVKLHVGNITVESIEGQGSTFTVEIPSGKSHLPPEQVSEKSADDGRSILSDIYLEDAISLTGTGKEPVVSGDLTDVSNRISPRKNILVVDDNADMREYITRLLRESYDVETASNGMQALQKLQTFRADVVLSDIMMPVMDGIQLLTSLKENKSMANIPVILLSARAGEEARIEGYGTGADDYLVKPFSAKELLARIKAQLNIARIRNHTEASLKNIFQQAPVLLLIVKGPHFTVEIANDKVLEYWDKRLDEVIYKPLLDVVPELASQGILNLLRDVYQNSKRYNEYEREVFIIRKGIPVATFVNFLYEPLKDEQNTTIGVSVVANDVTDAVLARRKIQASESRFRNLVIQAPVGIAILTGSDFTVEVANDSYLQLVGRTSEEFINKPLLQALPEIENTPVIGLLKQVVDTEESYYGYEFPIVLKRKGKDDQCYFNFVYQPLTTDGETAGVVVVVIEITDIVIARTKAQNSAIELEEKVKERTSELMLVNARLEMSNHDLEQFAYVASHDLQEPLRKIQTFSGLLKNNLSDYKNVRKYIDKIDTSAERMTALIKDVLNYSKLSKGEEQFISIDLNSVVQNVESDFELLIEEKKANIKRTNLPVIMGIPLQINQLFFNLISNSLKFSKDNPLIEITGRELPHDEVVGNKNLNPNRNYVELQFRDNGIGFEQKYADKIFVIFQRLNYNNASSGTGIGLALCKKIVENHGGEIEAFSELGKGALFRIHLPAN